MTLLRVSVKVGCSIASALGRIPARLLAFVLLLTLTSVSQTAITPQMMSMSIGRENFSPTSAPGNYWPPFSVGSIRLWDSNTAWEDLEVAPNSYRWDALNGWLNLAKSHGVTDVLYTFGSIPAWASGSSDTSCKYGPGTCYPPADVDSTDQYWKDFITALVTTGKGRIKYYQFFNTPQDPTHWKGSVAQLMRMSQDAHDIIRSLDPNAKILSPPIGAYHVSVTNPCYIANKLQTWFFAPGGGSLVDIVSFNSYFTTNAEDVIPVIQCLVTMLKNYAQDTKPLWSTEGSWGSQTDLSNSTLQSAFVARTYLVHASNRVVRFYWYGFNHSNWGVIWDPNTGLHPAGVAYKQVYNWVVGATLATPCAHDSNNLWTCLLTRANGYQAQPTWITGAATNYNVPAQYVSYRNLSGVKTAVPATRQITIGSSPILLENQ